MRLSAVSGKPSKRPLPRPSDFDEAGALISTLHLDSCSQKKEFDERYLGCGFPALDPFLS